MKHPDGEATVRHCLQEHKNKQVSILRPVVVGGRVKYQSVHFNMNTSDVTCDPQKVNYNTTTKVVSLPTDMLLDSSAEKTMKLDEEPHKNLSLFKETAE